MVANRAITTEDLALAKELFDHQLTVIRSLVEASIAKQEAHHMAVVSEISSLGKDLTEVKADVKLQNGRVGRLETDMAYTKGQREGGSGMFNALLALFGALLGSAGTAIAITQIGG